MLRIPFFEDKIPRVEAGDGSGLHNIEGVVFMEDLPVAVHHHGYGLRDHRGVADSLSRELLDSSTDVLVEDIEEAYIGEPVFLGQGRHFLYGSSFEVI